MEIVSITTIKILLLFFPGIIYCLVHEKITFHPKREFNYFLLRSFVFGVISYITYGIISVIFQGKDLEDVYFLKYNKYIIYSTHSLKSGAYISIT